MLTEFQYDVFLSHNSADKPRVRRLAERLRAAGLRVWFDEWIIQPGDDIYLAIERGLEASRTLVLCLSPAALGSDWVGLERSTVLFRDPANAGRRFIPLLLADCKLPDALRRYRHVDYRQESQAAFDGLLPSCRIQSEGELRSQPAKGSVGCSVVSGLKQEDQLLWGDGVLRKHIPPGLKLVWALRGHKADIGYIAWTPDGRLLASPSNDKTIRLWSLETGKCLRTLIGHKGYVVSVAFDASSRHIATGSGDRTARLWDVETGGILRSLRSSHPVRSVAFNPKGQLLATGDAGGRVILRKVGDWNVLRVLKAHYGMVLDMAFDTSGLLLASTGTRDRNTRIWSVTTGQMVQKLEGPGGPVTTVRFSSNGLMIATGAVDGAVQLWESSSGRLLRTLEGHTKHVAAVAFSHDDRVFASKGADGTVRLWSCESWTPLVTIQEPTNAEKFVPGLHFHPKLPLLAVVGSDPGTSNQDRDRVIHIYELDFASLLGQNTKSSAHYVNAKVVLVGDTGVGKTGLSLVLNNQPYKETDSTAGRHIWAFDSKKVELSSRITQTRETLLWDLAGQPGYRVIHQLHLNEVAVALVVFDARSETDPLAGVRHWERALRLAQQRQGSSTVPMKKFLISARNDRGGVSISEDMLQAIPQGSMGLTAISRPAQRKDGRSKNCGRQSRTRLTGRSCQKFHPQSYSLTSSRSCWRSENRTALVASKRDFYHEFAPSLMARCSELRTFETSSTHASGDLKTAT